MPTQSRKAYCRRLLAALMAAGITCASPAFAAHPDFTGTWTRDPPIFPPGDDIPMDIPLPGGQPSLREPYARQFAAYQKRIAYDEAHGIQPIDPSTRCLPEGMPEIMGAIYDLQILQSARIPDQVVVLAEYLSQIRRIFLNATMPSLNDIKPSYNGYSVAHWEGDTLVVRTLGVSTDVELLGIPHSSKMEITERWRMTGPDRFWDNVRIDDPQILAKPYEYALGFSRDKGYRILEYICVDNHNYAQSNGGLGVRLAPEKPR